MIESDFDPCFEPAKVQAIAPLIKHAKTEINILAGLPEDTPFPPIKCMPQEEISELAEQGYGHGIFRHETGEVAINADMSPEGIYINFIHENLHRVFPDMPHNGIRILTALVDCQVRTLDTKECNVLIELTEPGRK